ncbi:MAG: response regulator [Limisphaerales bacterium]
MKTILLVDDDELFGDMIQKTLLHLGYVVVRARDGNEALQLYDPLKVDLVLTDLIMPDKEGLELITELHRAHPGVKIIAMSGGGRNTPEEYLPVARFLGAMKTLTKPFRQEALAKALGECLEVV